MTTTRVYIDSTVTATRSLGKIILPITALPSIIPNMILQFDVNGTTSSLSRNRVGSAMSVVGSPAITGYAASLNETNYIDTGISISPYNNSDMTFISISDAPDGKFNTVGVMQVNTPKRTRSHGFFIAARAGGTWNISEGGLFYSVLDPTAVSGMGLGGIFTSSRMVINNGYGVPAITTNILATNAMVTVKGATAPPRDYTGNILIGASADHGTTVTGKVFAVLAFNRSISSAELSTIYASYKQYFAGLGVTI